MIDNERTRDAVKRDLLAPSEFYPDGQLRHRLVKRGRIRTEAGLTYAVEAAERMLRLGRTTHTKAAERVPPAQRPAVERIVRDELLAGGWPGHVSERIDAVLDEDPDQAGDVVPIAAAPSSTMTGRSSQATRPAPPTTPAA